MSEVVAADDTLCLLSSSARLSHGDVRSDVFGFRDQVPEGGVAALHTNDACAVGAALVSLEGWAAEVLLFPPEQIGRAHV